MALCDGAGSYPHSELGAQALSDALSTFLCDQFYNLCGADDNIVKLLVIEKIQKCLGRLREMHGCRAQNAYASTAIACAMEGSSGRYIAVHLGDGFLGAIHGEGSVRRLTVPEDYGAGGNSAATMLSTGSVEALFRAIMVVRGVADGIFMASDGAQKLYSRQGEDTEVVQKLVKGVRKVGPVCAELLMEKTAQALGAMDDVSIALMLRGFPTAQALSFRCGKAPQRTALRQRRVLNSFGEYAKARDAGFSRKAAARRAGWGRRGSHEKIEFSERAFRVY